MQPINQNFVPSKSSIADIMSTLIICPNCKTQFEPEAAIAQSVEDRVRKEFNQKWAELTKQKDDQLRQKEQQWQEEKKAMEGNLLKELNTKVRADFETQLRLLEDINKTNEAKLSEAREKELDFLKKMQELKTKEQEMELEVQRKLTEERNKITEAVKKEEEEKNRLRDTEYDLKLKDKNKQLEDQRKLIEDLRRKSEQGSMQLQGEVQELALEQLLRDAFPFDIVSEVGKGVKGADCIQTVRNNYGNECGKIIFESKRTKDFSAEWIEKLKADMRVLGADVAVIVTQAMPRDMNTFGEKDGIWICSFSEVRALVHVLRDAVIRIYNASKSQENKGDKIHLLYNYLISGEFSEQWRAIREGFMSMKMSIQRERDQMEKMWKAREKQLEKVLLNAAHIRGSIEGIAGMDVDLNLLPEGGDSYLLE
jgi:hypothetical protein